MKIETLSRNQLALNDETFDLGFARTYEALHRAVAAVGILQPLLVRRGRPSRPHQIVCGFGRARVARDLGLPRVAARILPRTVGDADCLRLALFDNVAHRQFNPVERAIIFERLGKHTRRERLLREYMPLLGLPPRAHVFERTLALIRLTTPLQRELAAGRIEEKIGVLAAARSAEDQEALAHLLARCRPTVSVARELFENLVDISERDGRSICEILYAPALAAIVDDEDKSAPERTAALRCRLHGLRYTRLGAAEARFARTRAALHLPPSMRLDPAPNFESDEMRLEIRFCSEEMLRDSAAALSRLLDDPSLLRDLWPEV